MIDKDRLIAEANLEIDSLKKLVLGMAERISAQSDLLSKRAEKCSGNQPVRSVGADSRASVV